MFMSANIEKGKDLSE